MTMRTFMEELSSASPTPGGGGASALIGMVGSSLCSMVGNLTTGKKKYAQYEDDIERILIEAKAISERLYLLIEEDAKAFLPLSKAYGIKKDDPERDAIMEVALVEASKVPLQIIKEISNVIPIMEELTIKGSKIAISDVAVAAAACEAGIKGAVMNVYINTKLMKNREVAETMNIEAKSLVHEGCKRCQMIYHEIGSGL